MVFGLRGYKNYFVDPYGNVGYYGLDMKYVTTAQRESSIDMPFLPSDPRDNWSQWPYVKGVSYNDASTKYLAECWQDYLYGHVFTNCETGNLHYQKEFSPKDSLRFDPVKHRSKLIPLCYKTVKEMDDKFVLSLSEAKERMATEEHMMAYKIGPSGSRLFARGDYVISYTAHRTRQLSGVRVKQDGWVLVNDYPLSVHEKYELLCKLKTPPKAAAMLSEPDVTIKGNVTPTNVVDSIDSLAILASKLIDVGKIEEGALLAKKLAFTLGNVSWKMRDDV